MLDHDARSYELIHRPVTDTGGLTRDDVLDNITLCWLTDDPAAVAPFQTSSIRPRGVRAERAYPKLVCYNKLDKDGHFAAWEQPQLFSEEVRAGFRPLHR
jgi:hypothetical protein